MISQLLLVALFCTPYQVQYHSPDSLDGGAQPYVSDPGVSYGVGGGDVLAFDADGNATDLTAGAYGTVERVTASPSGDVAFTTATDLYVPSGPSTWTSIAGSGSKLTPDGFADTGQLVYTTFGSPSVFLWNGVSSSSLPDPAPSATQVEAVMNDAGTIAVKATVGQYGMFLYDGVSSYTDLSTDPDHSGFDTGITGTAMNQLGQIAWIGSSPTLGAHLFFWDGLDVHDLSVDLGIRGVTGVSLNDLGEIAFTSNRLENPDELLFWDGVTATRIGTSLSGISLGSLNNAGQISFTTNQPDFVLTDDVPPPNPPMEGLVLGMGFSGAGFGGMNLSLAGFPLFSEFENDAWLVSPLAVVSVPEPATILAVLFAIGGGLWIRKRLAWR